MRPIIHPSIDEISVEGILHALADPVRVAIFREIAGSDCARSCSNFLSATDKSVPKSTLSQHFRALRDAGLIRSERQGVELHNTSRCMEIDQRFPGLIAAIIGALQIQSAATKRRGSTRGRKTAARASL